MTKQWYLSRTILGALVAVLAQLAQQLAGLSLDDATQAQLVDLLSSGATVAGGLLAIWGRVRATRPIAPLRGGTMTAVLLAVLLTGGPMACATPQAETTAQRVFALTGDYTVLQQLAVAYVTRPDARPDVVAQIQRADRVATAALHEAGDAVQGGQPPAQAAALAAATQAMDELRRSLTLGQEGAR